MATVPPHMANPAHEIHDDHPASAPNVSYWKNALELVFLVLASVYLIYRMAGSPASAVRDVGRSRMG